METKKNLDIRVASKVEDNKIVINKGADDGITSSMEFLVYRIGDEIKDPISGKSLGQLENPLGTFKVMHVQDNITTLLSKLKTTNPIFQRSLFFQEMDSEQYLLKSIKVGDRVKVINQS